MEIEKAYEICNIMIQVRFVEEAIIKEYPAQEVKTPVHLYIGQEAIAASISVSLDPNDFIVSNHRSHGHCLAKGMDVEAFFKELYGKKGGVSGGWGGSMHLCDMKLGIVGTSAIVAGSIPIGVGIALKQKIKKEGWITVIYFGDGAVDEGIFWEAINFCSLKKLPVLFVMENNKFASQTSISDRHSYEDIIKVIAQFGIPSFKVDGNNFEEIYEVSSKSIQKIREGRGPFFIECVTYRLMGHVGVSDDTDTGYRTREEYDYWKKKCPIVHIENYLYRKDNANAKRRINEIREIWHTRITNAIKSAKEAPYAVD